MITADGESHNDRGHFRKQISGTGTDGRKVQNKDDDVALLVSGEAPSKDHSYIYVYI